MTLKSRSITNHKKIKSKHHRVRTEVKVGLENLYKTMMIRKFPRRR